jgi:hypothetical protein
MWLFTPDLVGDFIVGAIFVQVAPFSVKEIERLTISNVY